jgi:D-glycero-D-manno-heptose 1,7-bisphosphate phosphatase
MQGHGGVKRALFLDRDGTLVEPRHYPSRPEDLVLSAGIGPLLRTFQDAGWELVVITNQSGLARGLFTEDDLAKMHAWLREMLGDWAVELNAIQFCPHHIDGVIPHLAVACNCRKPAPGMLLNAARERDIDLSRSWMIGDILDDIEAGHRAGCRAALVDLGTEALPASEIRWPDLIAPTTAEALALIAIAEGLRSGSLPPTRYQPTRWSQTAAVTR